MKRIKRRIMQILLVFFLISAMVCTVGGITIYSFGEYAKPEKSDCIIILGCQVYGREPSPFLKSRLDEGIRLYNSGYASHIIVSGGRGSGEDISEAMAMKGYLTAMGVDPSIIIIEDQSGSTYENIKNSAEKMDQNGFKSGIIVSNRYHLKRASLIAEREGIMGSYSGVFVSDYRSHELKGFLREIIALIKYYVTGK